MDNLLSRFALDYWYQVLMAVCIAVFLLNGAGLLHVLPTIPTTIISLGGFFVGFGEFINHPLKPSWCHHPLLTRWAFAQAICAKTVLLASRLFFLAWCWSASASSSSIS
jgi:hypothetical protein